MSQAPRLAIFENSQNITISGGAFNVHATINDSDDSDFRRIRLGDLDLLKEVGTQNIVQYHDVRRKRTGAVIRRVPEVVGARRIHHARIHGSQKIVTAVVYEGLDFERHREHAEQREDFRHPSLVQLLGVALGSRRFKALIYNDGLIPVNQFRRTHEQSPLTLASVEYQMGRHLLAAVDYWDDATGTFLLNKDTQGYWSQLDSGTTLWIRTSTGQLCIEVGMHEDLDLAELQRLPTYIPDARAFQLQLTSDANQDQDLISGLNIGDIHTILCSRRKSYTVMISEPGTILLGSLSWPKPGGSDRFRPFSEISLLDHLRFSDTLMDGWNYVHADAQSSSLQLNADLVLANGWTRIALRNMPTDVDFKKRIWLRPTSYLQLRKVWLSQANHVMYHSGLNADDCRMILRWELDEFTLQGTFMAEASPDDIYLFLFSPEMDGSGGHLRVCLPPKNKTYYWSLNPEGTERLSEESEEQLGLPHIRFQAAVCGGQWSQDDYDLVTQFHLNKGFDPYSQHFAIELDYPLVDINRLITIMAREQKQEAEEHREFPAPHWSIVSQDDPYLPVCGAEVHAISGAFKFIMNVQFALFLFLGLSWLCVVCSLPGGW